MNRLLIVLLVVCAAHAALVNFARAQGDGARAYFATPKNTHILNTYGLFLRGNQSLDAGSARSGLDIDVNVAVAQYTFAGAIGDMPVAPFIAIPFGEVEGEFSILNTSITGNSSGLGDIQAGAVVGLIGSPVLNVQDYVQFDPGFSMGLMGRVTIPTGDYSDNRFINLGANRWSMKFGVPIGYYRGNSYLDPHLTTFELLPSVTFFTDNHDPLGADRTGQDALFQIEGHIAQNLNKAIWVSLDALYIFGGETSRNGDDANDFQRSFGIGATVNVNLSKSLAIRATYGKTVAGNEDGPDGDMVRVGVIYSF